MLNREELEFIWETQPHGYFPKLVKELKARANLNKYLVKARVIQVNRIELDSREMEVYASSSGAKEIEKAKEVKGLASMIGKKGDSSVDPEEWFKGKQ